MKTLACTLSRQDISTRLHWHVIFGDVSVSDMCWTRILARLIGLRCPNGVVFFFFFCFSDTAPTRRWHASSGKEKKKKIKILIDGQTLEWEVRNLKSETHIAQSLISLCSLPSVPRGCYIRLIGESASSLCPSVPFDLSLSLPTWTGPSFSSFFLFRDFFFFFFSFFFLLSADCFGPLVWCSVACYIYNTQSFFFNIFNPTHYVILYCIYIYIYCFFT